MKESVTLVLLILSGFLYPAVQAQSLPLKFSKKSVSIDESAQSSLDKAAHNLQSDKALVASIDIFSGGIKPSSIDFIVAKTRALKIFQGLVTAGVDPARIVLIEKPGPVRDDVEIILKTDSFVVTPKLVPDPSAEIAPKEFLLTFDSGLAEPQGGGNETFNAFLKGVGQPGHDALIIEGKTDSTGNAVYNKALSELRALRVFENLVRSGLPPYRITTSGVTSENKEGKAETAAEKQKSRRVIVRWIADEKIAAIAAVKDKKEEPEPVVEKKVEPVPPVETSVEKPREEPPETIDPKSKESNGLNLLVPIGLAIPAAGYSHDAKAGFYLGLGLEQNILRSEKNILRASLLVTHSSFPARDDGLSGDVKIWMLSARTDYLWMIGSFMPFVGLTTGAYKWNGTIKQTASGLEHEKNTTDFGAGIIAGMDYDIHRNIILSPEISWHRLGGAFSESIATADICLRWRM